MKTVRNRYLRSLLGLATLLATGAVAGTESLAASLRHHVVIRGDNVTLGDIFDDAGRHAERVILQAPEPGRKIILNVKWLYHAARSYGVDWKPMSTLDQVVLERSTNVISTDHIRETLDIGIRQELSVSDRFEIELDNRLLQMHLPGENLPSINVQTLRVDRQSQRFSAILVGGEGSSRTVRTTATGRFYRLIDIPVLTRRIRGGEIISPQDIRMVTLRADKVDMNALLDPEALIGMSPQRGLSSDRPIKASDIRNPILVAKGSMVTMVFRTEKLMLTAQGKALQDGSENETIRIVNLNTHKTIDGIVTGSGTVSVVPVGRLAYR
jgi:flagella basal body P-ring formation protein FlgA